MTPTELREVRQSLGLSAARFAALVGVADGRTVRKWEAGDDPIPGPVRVLVPLLRSPAVRRLLGLAA